MFYKFDKETLTYKQVKWVKPAINYVTGVFALSFLLVLMVSLNTERIKSTDEYSEAEVMVIMNNYNKFSPEKLQKEINKLNFRFPHIVYAQAYLESNKFTSKIFNENHNLFGMKEAKTRANTARGTQYGHAYYDDWEDCLVDYSLYYSSYLFPSIKTEDDYYNYLSQSYAEDPNYVTKLKNIVTKQKLKEKFNIN